MVSCSNYKPVPGNVLRVGGLKFKKHKTSLFFLSSESARIVIATAYDRLERYSMMNQEWFCTSTVIAQTTMVFITTIYDMLKTQIWYFIKVAVTLFLRTTICGRSIVLKEPPDFNEARGDSGERIDLRISGQTEVPHTKRESGEHFYMSSLTQQVYNSPNKSMLITDLIKNCAQKKTEHVEYYRVSHHDSETHAEEIGNMERHGV